MKQIKDNRVDAFEKVIGFEFDERSGLYLPNSARYAFPSDDASTYASGKIGTYQTPKGIQRLFDRVKPGLLALKPSDEQFLINPNMLLYDWGFDNNPYDNGYWGPSLVEMAEGIEAEIDATRALTPGAEYTLSFRVKEAEDTDEAAALFGEVQAWLDDCEAERTMSDD